MSLEKKFLESLKEGYKQYLISHARSSKKVEPMHKCIAEILKEKLGDDYEIKSMGIGDGKECKVEGKYYKKDLDITILYNGKPISAIGFKFVTSNYKQNSNNYFENMLGETANVRRNDLLYAQILVLKEKMPYYSSDKKTYTKIEHVNDNNLLKYFKLGKDNAKCLFHKPDFMYINFIKTGDEEVFDKIVSTQQKIENKKEFNKQKLLPLLERNGVSFSNLDELEIKKEEIKDFIIKHSDFEAFIEAFVNATKSKIYGK